MDEVQRYGPTRNGPYQKRKKGKYVLHADHEAALAKQREEMIARVECERLLLDSPYGKNVAEIEGDLTYNRAIDDAIAAVKEVDQ